MKKVINTTKAPKALGPYSQAIEIGNLVFTSGQLGIDPVTGNLVKGGVETETEQTLENLKNVLSEAGLNMSNIVKTTIFITDMENFTKVNEVYAKYFSDPYPARATVEISAIAKGGLVEIDAVAVKE